MGRIPDKGRRAPLMLTSPRKAQLSPGSRSCPEAARIPIKMGRSYTVPLFRVPAGARLMVIRPVGNCIPLLRTAVRTRSRDSRTAASGSPTMSKLGSPWVMPHSTVTP